jgi:hypothetical protein
MKKQKTDAIFPLKMSPGFVAVHHGGKRVVVTTLHFFLEATAQS